MPRSKPQKLTRHLPLLNPYHPINYQFSRSNITLHHCQRMLVLQPKMPPRDMHIPLPPLHRSTIPGNRPWPIILWIRPQPLPSLLSLHTPPITKTTPNNPLINPRPLPLRINNPIPPNILPNHPALKPPNTNILPEIRPPPNPQIRAPRAPILLRPRLLRHVQQPREIRRHLPRLRPVAQRQRHVVDVVPAPHSFVVAGGR